MIKIIALSIGLFISLAIHFCFADQLNIAISAAPNSLVPFYSTDANSQNINRLVHKSLIDFNQKMQFECKACQSYEERIEGGKQIVKFTLRNDLRFSDGTLVTSEDIKRSWIYFAKDKIINSSLMGSFESIEDIKIIDKYNLEIIYSSFSLENLSNLALLKIIKIKNNKRESLVPLDVIGCGDYVYESISPLEIIVKPMDIKKFSLVFKVVKDETTLALKLINKEIDLSVATISPRKIFWLKNRSSELRVWDIPSGNYQFVGINHKKEMFQDRRLRKAISLLIPREDILKYKLKDTAVLSSSMFSPAFADMYEKKQIDTFNPALARNLLDEIGYKKNKKGVLVKNGKVLDIDWKVSNNKASIEIVEIMKHFLEKEGFKINISIQEWGTFMNSYKTGNFDIVVAQWVGFTGPDMLKFVFYSKNTPPQGGNRISYNNQDFDKTIDQATSEINPQKRIAFYKEASEIANRDYAYINLWHPNIVWIGSNCLKNIELDSTGGFYPLLKIEKSQEGHCGK